MLQLRRDSEIHREDGGWFQARWHFSFDRYRDPEQMGVGPLRVFNHDRLAPGAIWPMHPHADVDVITFHQDAAVFVAALSAGTEVTHRFGSNRAGYLYLIEGAVAVGGDRLSAGDAAKIFDQAELPVRAEAASELIMVDVPLRFTPVGVWAR